MNLDRAQTLPPLSLYRLLATMSLLLAPHLLRLPAWETLSVSVLLIWRAWAAQRGARMPPPLLRLAMTLGAFGGVYASYGRFWGQNAGIALLVAMLALKLTELRARRDIRVTIFLMYLLLSTHFLYSQALWTAAYLMIASIAITALLIDVHPRGDARDTGLLLRTSSRMLLQSLPLALLMFLLFPRLPGPLWALPDDTGGGRSGLSDDMAPGDIGALALSGAVAFRVRFDAALPAADQRYWRGPPLTDFDGRRWHRSSPLAELSAPAVDTLGPALSYTITLEPSGSSGVIALDVVSAGSRPAGTRLSGEYQLMANQPLHELRRYALASYSAYRLQTQLPETLRRAALALPAGSAPRARALAAQWRARAHGDQDVIDDALALFHAAPFAYTLQPPRLGIGGVDPVDQFLFETRSGFCEHYASAFTVLMRAAGIPARVITGYVGGESNPFGDWLVLRQSDAHAWSEVWLPTRGWVRIDPTSAVAAERVERRIRQVSMGRGGDALLGTLDWSALRGRVAAGSDWIDAKWNALVLGYGSEQQHDLLARIGLGDIRSMLLALTATVTATLSVIGWRLMRRAAPAGSDPVLTQWKWGTQPLTRIGLGQRPDESPGDYAHRVIMQRPGLVAPMRRLLSVYLKLRYESQQEPGLQNELISAARNLRQELRAEKNPRMDESPSRGVSSENHPSQ